MRKDGPKCTAPTLREHRHRLTASVPFQTCISGPLRPAPTSPRFAAAYFRGSQTALYPTCASCVSTAHCPSNWQGPPEGPAAAAPASPALPGCGLCASPRSGRRSTAWTSQDPRWCSLHPSLFSRLTSAFANEFAMITGLTFKTAQHWLPPSI